mmetsp:Transcript_24656/g.40888  ORF Transcript_24656/g.40888 Transcript_24656/m.40888 type:complete len:377 (-) Transcript_24656:303-1433(-)|eukprot:CAMPEP_0119304048 /NCGR_PEP_ID=MMETSP1333-20130426/5371_1 /TAXON_ID=418940 /ORGANISM="Scyphosphaera apsteinii, Strain RCC1455" /LENGTH=376 /DNA_ID=CAMNT_0007306859 /DNA_START=117 /DNA_END=1247 /DNA_ORIENTATION=-
MVSMPGANAFESKFREFLQEPETQDVIREDQRKELDVMKKIDEMEKLEELQGQREQLAVALQDLPPESQRLIYPILRLKMVQNLLFATLKETRKSGISFVHAVRDPGLMRMLEKVRDEMLNDPDNAKRIEGEWFHNVGLCAENQVKKAPKKERGVLPATQMLPIITSGAQLRVNGNHKFRQGKFKEALEMYMQGCVGFELYQATNAQDQGLLDEVHVQVRKNTQAAAIKTRDWTICITSCNEVLKMVPDDTKSLYRRALANWHLGEVETSTEDLEEILKKRVTDYNEIHESSYTKKLARSMLRQIEASEERAEIIEHKMAKALAVTIPITGAAVGGGPAPPAPPQATPSLTMTDEYKAAEQALMDEAEDAPMEEAD